MMILIYSVLLQITIVFTGKTKSYININENNYITYLLVSNFPSSQFSLSLFVFSSDGKCYQPDTTVTAKIGDNVTLKCNADLTTNFSSISWFHLKPPKHLQYIVGMFKYSTHFTVHGGFSKQRFKLFTSKGIHYLQILNTEDSDSGIYYCGAISGLLIRIGNGTSLDLEGILFHPSYLC